MKNTPIIQLMYLNPIQDADIPMPEYMTPQSSGMDLYAAITKPVVLEPGDITMIPTGFAMAIPGGFEAQIRPRSGVAVKYGVSIINSPGTIDSDYRGEVKIALINHGRRNFMVERGDRIAQMVIQTVCRAELAPVKTLDETVRNTGGFGHTGR